MTANANFIRRSAFLCSISLWVLFNALPVASYATDRIPISCEVNGKPVTLVFDTGSDSLALFRSAIERLGLTTSRLDPIKPGGYRYELTEECKWTTGTSTQLVRFPVIDAPACAIGYDGIIGWQSLSNVIFRLDVEQHIFSFLSDVPAVVKEWAKWKLVPNSRVVMFECANTTDTARIAIDTGSDQGVWLSPDRWRRWRADRAGLPATLDSGSGMTGAQVVSEVLRAKKIAIGGITLNDMPIAKVPPPISSNFEKCDAVFGLWVLGQLRLVVDGRNGWVYTKSVTNPSGKYPYFPYNQLGAVFIPKDLENDDILVAHVMKDSPAYRAGIRDGDILLRVGVFNVTKWRSDPYFWPSRFWAQPAGTRHKLTLKRGDQQFETTVTLEELPAVD